MTSTTPPLVRDLEDIPRQWWVDQTRGRLAFRTIFGDGSHPSDTLTAGVTELEPNGRLALHRHAPPEIYFVIEGRGRVAAGGVEHAVAAGSAVFIPAHCEHGVRNDGPGLLRFFYTFAVDSFDEVEYTFSQPDPANP